MTLSVRSLSGVSALACGLLLVVAIWPACACLPLEYREVELAVLPATARGDAGRVAPALQIKRAWEFGIGLTSRRPVVDGYLIRGREPGSWWDRDVKVHARPASPDPEPVELQPID